MKPILVIACGASKRDRPSPAHRLYTGSIWQTYQKHRRDTEGADWKGPHPELDVFVLSAAHGLEPEERTLAPYNKRLTGKRGEADAMGALIATLIVRRGWLQFFRQPVYFVGGRHYLAALRAADGLIRAVDPRIGLEIVDLDARGIGHKRQALGRFLLSPTAAPFDLLAAIRQERGGQMELPFDLIAAIADQRTR